VMVFVIATTLLPEPGRAALGVALLAGAVVLAGAFVTIDRRSAIPLLPRTLLRARPLRQGALGALLNTFTTSSAVTLTTLYLQHTLGRSALSAAAMLLPFSLAVIGGAALSARAQRQPQHVIAAGLIAIAVSDATLIAAAPSAWALPMTVAAGGAGIGLSSVAATGLGTSVAIGDRGTASGIINTAAQLGTAFGVAVLLLVTAVSTGVPEQGTTVPSIGWGLGALISFGGAATFMIWARSDVEQGGAGTKCPGETGVGPGMVTAT